MEHEIPKATCDELAKDLCAGESGSIRTFLGLPPGKLKQMLSSREIGQAERLPLMISFDTDGAGDFAEKVVSILAKAALESWPFWYAGVDFLTCENTTAGRHAVMIKARALTQCSELYRDISYEWL